MADLSLNDKLRLVNRAVMALQPPANVNSMPLDSMMEPSWYPYADEVYDSYVIIEIGDNYWRADYTLDGDMVTITDQAAWTAVEEAWVAAKTGARHSSKDQKMLQTMHDHAVSLGANCPPSGKAYMPAGMDADLVVVQGSVIKALGNGKVGGYLVRFTDSENPDLTGDYFDAKTDYDFADGDKVTIYYNHGLDPELRRRKLGGGTLKKTDVGVWVEAQLQQRDEYEKWIYQLVQEGKFGWSSGTLPGLVEREKVGKAMWIKMWPLGKDASITPTPAAGPFLTVVEALKKATADSSPKASAAQTDRTSVERSAAEQKAKRLSLELDLLEIGVIAC